MKNNKSQSKQIVNGIVLVDKPKDITSNSALQKVKRLYNAKKAGHTGSLDPMATGMLPICFGEATKVSQFLLDADKRYTVTALLGVETNTLDAMGEIVATVSDFSISEQQILEVISGFIGDITQIPPMFSALKHQGQPLYKLARAGIEIERKERTITIHDINLDGFDGKYFKLTVSCTKGTYIRTLIADIGRELGVGAHVTQLHRTYTAGFANEKMYSLDELNGMSKDQLADCLMPVDRAILHLQAIHLSAENVGDIYLGRSITLSDEQKYIDGSVRLYSDDNSFVGLGEFVEPGVLKGKRLLSQEQDLNT
ncbi:MAG: tRNA pseudouridine(55) synthase TruB [Legionellaceae bacterium]|nr:tRNA pseudouridine(55) synthase TruB [Legionellaceae bacterium]